MLWCVGLCRRGSAESQVPISRKTLGFVGNLAANWKREILLPSAVHLEERLTVSQSVSQSGKQSVSQTVSRASRQADRNTQFGFFQWQTRLSTAGKGRILRSSDGPMVMQLAADMQVGGSNPGWLAVGGANRPVNFAQFDLRSNPSEHKLLTPPPPTPKK